MHLAPTGQHVGPATAQVQVKVGANPLTAQRSLIGRVFVDTNGDSIFEKGEIPVPGVRVFLSDGQAAVTDSQGLYSLPAVPQGSVVASIDAITLPNGYSLSDEGERQGRSLTRLLRTPLGGGSLLRQNFALRALPGLKPAGAVLGSLAPPASPQPVTQTAAAAIPNRSARRNPVRRIEIVSAKREVQAGGRDYTTLTLRAFDEEGKPVEGLLNVSASSGHFGLPGSAEHTADPAVADKAAPLDFQSIGAGAGNGGANMGGANSGAAPATAQPGSTRDLLHSAGPQNSARTPQSGSRQETVTLYNGEATILLTSALEPGSAQIVAAAENAGLGMGASTRQVVSRLDLAFVPELRAPILVGLGELSFGRGAPEMALFDETGHVERRAQLFYSGKLPGTNLLTFAYSSQSPLNRVSGYDQMFNMDATNQQYVVFGDSSQRFYNAQSNSRLYARIDHGLSYLMFGDLSDPTRAFGAGVSNADLNSRGLTSFDRSITGLKLHLESRAGTALSVAGARPDTAYARDIFPGNALGLVTLSHQDVLPGSEVITLETRDRRNPAIIVSRETLLRSSDYTMDNLSGSIFFLRSISALDAALNLTQIVISYEYRAIGLSSSVYSARAEKRIDSLGLRIGGNFLNDRQGGTSSFFLAGLEAAKQMPHHGLLTLEVPVSHGTAVTTGSAYPDDGTGEHNGIAAHAELEQPLTVLSGVVHASFAKTGANFLNPFGATTLPGSQTAAAAFEFKPMHAARLKLGFTDERNKTSNVNNHRYTASLAWKQSVSERIDLTFGYDNRDYNDTLAHRIIDSNLLTFGGEWRVTNKLQTSLRREQNVGAADPTYPSQTVLAAKYQISPVTKLFYTQRLSSAPIVPIGDLSGAGFASVNSTRDLAVGLETKVNPRTSLTSRYEIDNGVNGSDSFAVMGVIDRLPLNEHTSVDAGVEHGLHVEGKGHDYNAGTAAISWRPTKFFRATSRYELRDQFGFASLITGGAAGRISSGVTALGQLQFVRGTVNAQSSSFNRAIVSLAIRPLKSDRAGLLFSYNEQSGRGYFLQRTSTLPVRVDILSADSWWQPLKRLELYGRFATSSRTEMSDGQPNLTTGTYLWQQRAQYRFARYFDAAGETRFLWQPVTATKRRTSALEAGGWILPDIRLGLGYSFESAPEYAPSFLASPLRQGIYFNITGKFSRLFNLFGSE